MFYYFIIIVIVIILCNSKNIAVNAVDRDFYQHSEDV